MNKLIKVLRSPATISDDEANDVFGLLIPIVEADPAAPAAVEAAGQLISRCTLSDDSPMAHVLDWWYVATTGRPTANGGAHRLPESLAESVRVPMQEAMALGTGMPAAEWLDKRRRLDARLNDLGNHLSLDHHGQVKLQGERPAWAWLRDQLDTTVIALRAGRRADRVEVEQRHFEQQLRDNGLEKGSRRWKEMVKRYRKAVAAVNETVDLHSQIQPWVRRRVPSTLQEIPPSVGHSVGLLAAALLRPLLAANLSPVVDRRDLADRLESAARAGNHPGRYQLARIACSWCQETGQEVPSLTDVLDRHSKVSEGLASLAQRPGVDTMEVDLYVADDDLDGAEEALTRLRADYERRERFHRTRSQYEGLQKKVLEAGFGDSSEWRHRLEEIAERLEHGDPHELAREIGATQRQLSKELDESLQEHLEDLEQLVEMLRELGAPDSDLFDWRKKILDVKSQPGGRGANDLRLELEADVQRVRQEIRGLVMSRLAEVEAVLTDERTDFSESDIGIFANRQSEIDSLLDEAELSDADLIDARARVGELQRDLGEHRIHRWHAEDGEAALVAHVVKYCTGSLDFDEEDIRRLHVALKTKPFVILAGLTGSGKSSLTRLYAEAVGASTANGQFRRVAVRPDWIDQSEVLGFVNPVSQRFVPGWLAETIRNCERILDRLHFVLLDEMNLAPVEQYLAEMLSAMEEARSGSDDVRLPLYSRGEEPENADEWPPDLRYPDNLIIVGTVNVDETTRPLSERVIDRANVLHLSVEVSERHHSRNGRSEKPWHVSSSEWRMVCVDEPSVDHHEFLVDVADTLRRANIGVGLRAHLELERFVSNAQGIMDPEPALDWGIVQRIIPKIRGFKGPLTDTLKELSKDLRNVGARESAAIIDRWLDDQVSDDEYLDGTDPRLTLART